MVMNSQPLYSKSETQNRGDLLKRQKDFDFQEMDLTPENISPVATAYFKRIQKAIIYYELNSFASFL